MASECGWDHDFILDTFTLDQVVRYNELLTRKKTRDLRMQTIAMTEAVGYAFGSIKKDKFMKFLDSLYKEKQTPEDSFDKMKKFGLNVEEK